jgi:hypothetical protein
MRAPLISASQRVNVALKTLCNLVKMKLMRQVGSSPIVVRRRQRQRCLRPCRVRIMARRLIALQQPAKLLANGVCLPFGEAELTTNNTFGGPCSVTTPEVSCLVESVRYWLRLPTAVPPLESRYLQQHSRSTFHLHSEKAGGRLIGCGLILKFLPGSPK